MVFSVFIIGHHRDFLLICDPSFASSSGTEIATVKPDHLSVPAWQMPELPVLMRVKLFCCPGAGGIVNQKDCLSMYRYNLDGNVVPFAQAKLLIFHIDLQWPLSMTVMSSRARSVPPIPIVFARECLRHNRPDHMFFEPGKWHPQTMVPIEVTAWRSI